MKLSGYKKLLLLGAVLLIIAGIVVVALKVRKEIELKYIDEICKNIFQNKNYITQNVEMFNDSVNILVESITDEEKEELVNKINEKYDTELTVEDLNVRSNSNVRIRDMIKPFIVPCVISALLIGAIYGIIYRNKEVVIKYLKTLGIVFLTEALIASVIAIVRIPLSQSIITWMLFVAIAEIMYCMNKNK